ncbi:MULTISPECIES: hypothetical protein [Neisseria]|uniref:Membrane-bound lysozyme-inhibitor of c-type lysozyme family protein n=1 Tax=Neisseria musculi TaxID=1815583 RepID=A0A7H1MDI7_9NEIS|nr:MULTISPECIES: hypothetical protein [Neisseria]MBF0804195.1 hypothetical protein [Neisseria sp. 19428wB4_WF04]QNT59702.1 membrane-bound lysozyme-inhibitor of c-type lysozyme family protein [Neisseria musculi]TFU43038.1 hypothetical protein E4T99_07505 [Neisseria sp. WF04]
MTRYALLLAVAALAACGTQKAVRPDAPAPAVAESQTQTIHYQTKKGKRLTAVYHNNHSPLTVELKQGNSVENLKQIQSWAKGVEYANNTTRWHVQEGRATLKRKGMSSIYYEIN